MINLDYYLWSVFFFFTYIYIEIFSSITLYSLFKNTKLFLINYSKKCIYDLNVKYFYTYFSLLILISVIFLKVEYTNNFIISLLLIFIIVFNIFQRYISLNLYMLMFNIITFIMLFNFVNNFVIFFLFIELYSIIFYFFFLYKQEVKSINLLQYKNMLLLYLFNNFFSSIMYLFGMYYIVYYYGTLNFVELTYLQKSSHWEIYFIIVSFILKLSLPGFHFLKIEIYKYLTYDVIILYSVLTLFLNYIFIINFFNQNIIYININEYKFFNLLVLFSLTIFIQKLKLNNFHEFIAYSGFSTNTLIIINYIV